MLPGLHRASRRVIEACPVRIPSNPMAAFVYIMTNKPRGTLYVGVTRDIILRAWTHKEGQTDGFTKRYGLNRLVYVEEFFDIRDAISREKQLKAWRRIWKIELIETHNPSWRDLYEDLLA
jgi:putative endonuclease